MIFAIDPGSDKTGTAVVNDDSSLVVKQIVDTPKLLQHLGDMYVRYPFDHVIMGNGTNHKKLQSVVERWIQTENLLVTFVLIDEKYTTVEGRKLYWQYTKRHGWRRFLPLSLQYPPEPVDDFVAWIIGCRYLKTIREKEHD